MFLPLEQKIAVTIPFSPATLFHALHQESHSIIVSASCTVPQTPSIKPSTTILIPSSWSTRTKQNFPLPVRFTGDRDGVCDEVRIVTREDPCFTSFSSVRRKFACLRATFRLYWSRRPRREATNVFPGRLDVARNYHGVRKSGRPSPFYDFNDFN